MRALARRQPHKGAIQDQELYFVPLLRVPHTDLHTGRPFPPSLQPVEQRPNGQHQPPRFVDRQFLLRGSYGHLARTQEQTRCSPQDVTAILNVRAGPHSRAPRLVHLSMTLPRLTEFQAIKARARMALKLSSTRESCTATLVLRALRYAARRTHAPAWEFTLRTQPFEHALRMTHDGEAQSNGNPLFGIKFSTHPRTKLMVISLLKLIYTCVKTQQAAESTGDYRLTPPNLITIVHRYDVAADEDHTAWAAAMAEPEAISDQEDGRVSNYALVALAKEVPKPSSSAPWSELPCEGALPYLGQQSSPLTRPPSLPQPSRSVSKHFAAQPLQHLVFIEGASGAQSQT
eukprot:6190139-Pleurochrysis_carterae.AAC.4